MRIAMIGTGYVGLVSGACFAEFGTTVHCMDRDADKIARLNRGELPIHEPGLDELLARNIAAGRLRFTTEMAEATTGADAIFIAVGTPSRRGNGEADLRFVHSAAVTAARAAEPDSVIVTKSTVPVGTGRELARRLAEAVPNKRLHVAANPEFLREGAAIADFMRPDRVVVGAESERARTVLEALYRPLYLNQTPLVITDLETAELAKYAANAFLATKIGFINEMADLCEAVGADVHGVACCMGLDGRIGPKFLHPGPGFGGSCFPKDTRCLAHTADTVGTPLGIVNAVIAGNDRRPDTMAAKIANALGGDVSGQTLAVLGLTFKPNTDDMREAPSLKIIPALQSAGVTIRAFDPHGMPEAAKHLADVVWCRDCYDAMTGADGVAILTEWNQFRNLDTQRMHQALRRPVVIDLRNIYDPAAMTEAGFHYTCVGRQ
ncbi:UDP-glucose dehydrogenase [Limimonas halophila]|uniref:UDP-glucose 6-dehydrogenase n=1 Tax=Limimonas halophila TaxID=1082479 RepID=A0A1G7S5M8_9PROT|nr:UDP-glucose/GDP-mannose dehydrogenase family protein [Limimonas halophila]SDG17480.1 UDP-glucose dehydrogenase [Limimonas halophila]